MSPIVIGIAVGALIGIVSAIVILLIIRFAVGSPTPWATVVGVVAQLVALAAFWAGGTWATGNLLQVPDADRLKLESSYWAALLVSVLILTSPMLLWLSLLVGRLTRVALEREIG